MLRTLFVFGVLVVGVVLVTSHSRHGEPQVRRVDAEVVANVALARQRAGFAVLAPTGLPQAWAPTSASYRTDSPVLGGQPLLHVGYVTPSGTYADLEESRVDVAPALDATDGDKPRPAGTTRVGDVTYDVRVARDGRTTLAGRVGTAYVGVTGGASQQDLETLLRSLR